MPDVTIRSPCHPERPEGVEGSAHYNHCIAAIRCVMSYFLTDEKVCKESPRTFRMVLGLSGRPKRKANQIIFFLHFFRFPLRNPLDRLCLLKEVLAQDGNKNCPTAYHAVSSSAPS